MKKLIKNNKTGKLATKEVPVPHLKEGYILVQNHYSALSVGTESSQVQLAQKNLLQKAQSRPEEFKKVIDLVKTEGIISAYKKAMNKLELPSPLGYSSAGSVLEVGKDVEGFKKGDRVACGGCGHAEIIAVPKNLCVKVPDDVDMKVAAFTTIASIAMQGVRLADVKLGDNVVVIGLGIVGQITLQLIGASGAKPIGIDIDKDVVDHTRKFGVLAFQRNERTLFDKLSSLTGGYGADKVIITAGTSSNDPIEFAAGVLRDKGHITVVGGVKMDLPREPFYEKELSLNVSRSYGPGRYDLNYEEKGQDYPIGFVRWTEKRNMEAVLELMKIKRLDLKKLITDLFPFSKAPDAYKKIKDAEVSVTGALLEYDKKVETGQKIVLAPNKNKDGIGKSEINIGFIGAGSYAQKFLLPNLERHKGVNFTGLSTATGMNADHIGRKYGFNYVTTDAEEIMGDDSINCVFIATRHNLHAKLVTDALKADKHVYVEKPMGIKNAEIEEIMEAWKKSKGTLTVGFNRRFSPFIKKTKNFLKGSAGPLAINYRINAGYLPPDHWAHDPELGGGRIVGEACHFVDLCAFIAGSEIERFNVETINSTEKGIPDEDTAIISLKFKNGSIAGISYFSNGSDRLSKERIEVFCENSSVVIDDFKKSRFFSGRKVKNFNLRKQDKGQKNEIEEYVEMLREGEPLIPAEELFSVSKAVLEIKNLVKN